MSSFTIPTEIARPNARCGTTNTFHACYIQLNEVGSGTIIFFGRKRAERFLSQSKATYPVIATKKWTVALPDEHATEQEATEATLIT